MCRVDRTWAGAIALLAATRAGAPPPLSSFPDVVVPPGLSVGPVRVPTNAHLWMFGDDAPAADAFGLALTVDGTPLEPGPRRTLGCCLVSATPQLSAGAAVHVLVSTPTGEREVDFVVEDVVDEMAPGLDDVVVLDDSGATLVLGVHGEDDIGLAGFVARDDEGLPLSATPEGRVLIVPRPAGVDCVDITALDLAAHESTPRRVCRHTGEGEGEGEGGEEGEGEDDDAAGCWLSSSASASASSSSSPVVLAVILGGLVSRRRRST